MDYVTQYRNKEHRSTAIKYGICMVLLALSTAINIISTDVAGPIALMVTVLALYWAYRFELLYTQYKRY